MVHPEEVAAQEGYRIWLRYDDGVSGEVDLSGLAGQGVFAAWNNRSFFESVRLTQHRSVAWGEGIELCADALYLRLTGKPAEDLMPAARGLPTRA